MDEFKGGSENARNILVERNLRLVAHVVKKFSLNQRDTEDLISIGTIGLIKGVTTFNPNKGARLATYAAKCIENATLSLWRLLYEDGKYMPLMKIVRFLHISR